MLPVAAPVPAAAADGLLQTLLRVSLTGVILFRPVLRGDPARLVDLAYVQLNPAAQRMLRLPECPTETFLTLYPGAVEAGIFAFYRDTFEAGTAGRYDVNYQRDGLDNYYHLAAQRHGDLFVVSFSDTADQPRTAVEQALRESQAAEQAARAEAERQRQRFYEVLVQLPAHVAVYHGPDHVYQFVNPPYQRLFPNRSFAGRPFREGTPEAEGLGVVALFDQVYRTGEPFYGHELEGDFDLHGTGAPVHLFFNLYLLPLRNAQGAVDGVLDFSYDVSEQVLARRQLQQFNQELEARVFERTQALRHAQATSVAAAQRLEHVTESLPSTSFTVDQTGQVLYISPQWYAYTGLAPGTDVNEAWPRLIHPDDLPAIAREFGAALVEGRPWRYEFRLRGANGAHRWFASQGVPEPPEEAEAAGRPRQWFGSNLDIDDLKQAQQAQQAQQRMLAAILTSLPADVVTFEGEELRYTFFNDALQRRVRDRAVLGRPLDELFPEAAAQGHSALLRQVLRTAEPFRAPEAPTYVQDPRTGAREETFLDLTYLPLRHGQEPPHGVLGFAVDVTERVRTRQRAEALQAELLAAAQRQAQERETLYQVFEQTTALVALLRAPGHRVEYVNHAYQAVFAGRQLVGLDLAAAVPELREQGFIAVLDRVYRTGEAQYDADVPFVFSAANGQPARTAHYNVTYRAYRENGAVAGVSIFAFDVTELVLARQERETQRQRLLSLFQEAPAGICILAGPELVFEFANPGYEQLVPGRMQLGRSVFEALPELVGTPVEAWLRQVYATGRTHEAQDMLIPLARAADGVLEDRYFSFVYQGRRDEHGRVDGVLAFAFEVTEQVVARRQVEALNQELAAINAELHGSNARLTSTNADLDTFIYTASHDLKAPIANIEGLLTALGEHLPEAARQAEPVPDLFRMMQEAVERFQLTIDQLTDITRLQQGQQQPAEAVDLAALVRAVRLDLAPVLAAAGAEVAVAVAECPTVRFSPKNLRSIVYNLLSNAIKYRHPDHPPVVQVRCRPGAGGSFVFEVEDNGLGLSESQQAKLFGMFQRLHTHVEGTGIGLYMVKKIIDNAGGTIAVRSQPARGTTFTVTLPG